MSEERSSEITQERKKRKWTREEKDRLIRALQSEGVSEAEIQSKEGTYAFEVGDFTMHNKDSAKLMKKLLDIEKKIDSLER